MNTQIYVHEYAKKPKSTYMNTQIYVHEYATYIGKMMSGEFL